MTAVCARVCAALAAGLIGWTLLAAIGDSHARGEGIDEPLTDRPGDAEQGKLVALDPSAGNCMLCHALPDVGTASFGDLGPPLGGVGARASAGELRLRLVDAARINPDSVMPPYHRTEDLNQVDARYRGRPILTAQQIEDLVAYLLTLK